MVYNLAFDGTKITIRCYCCGALILFFGKTSYKIDAFPDSLIEFDARGLTSIDFVYYE